VSLTSIRLLIMSREMFNVACESRTEHINKMHSVCTLRQVFSKIITVLKWLMLTTL
jgi:hypothetical protein